MMDRRTVLAGGIATAASTFAVSAAAGAGPTAKPRDAREALIAATSSCLKECLACLAHCQEMFRAGSTDMAACAVTVQDALATCQATLTLASLSSPLAKAQALVCADACAACVKACEKHRDMPVCKACLDACQACEKACRSFAA